MNGCVQVKEDGLAAIGALHQLRRLDVSFCKLDDKALDSISKGCPRLERLLMAGARGITAAPLIRALSIVTIVLCSALFLFLFLFLFPLFFFKKNVIDRRS